MMIIQEFIKEHFGVDEETFKEALVESPSAQGYIIGSISELLLKRHLEELNYEVIRIKEKPSGGNNEKNPEARGDFYIRKKGNESSEWFVIESKGLKSNSEFRGSKLDCKNKVFKFLEKRAFPPKLYKQTFYDKAYKKYSKVKEEWERKNSGKRFPAFNWKKEFPGPESMSIEGLWKNEQKLRKWVDSQPADSFKEEAYRKVKGPIAILETHSPSNRVGIVSKIKQAAPLVVDFNIMSVDLFLRTGKHEFVFMASHEISHSPTAPEHQYQNYIIDILVKGLKENVVVKRPWYDDIEGCIKITDPKPRKLDPTQIDNRS